VIGRACLSVGWLVRLFVSSWHESPRTRFISPAFHLTQQRIIQTNRERARLLTCE